MIESHGTLYAQDEQQSPIYSSRTTTPTLPPRTQDSQPQVRWQTLFALATMKRNENKMSVDFVFKERMEVHCMIRRRWRVVGRSSG